MRTCLHCFSPQIAAVAQTGVEGSVTEFRCKACGKSWAELRARDGRGSKSTQAPSQSPEPAKPGS